MPKNDQGPAPSVDTVTILDRLKALELLDEVEFKSEHHLGDSISGF